MGNWKLTRSQEPQALTEPVLREMDALGRALAEAVGLGGRSRRAGSAVERARQSVTKALRAVVRKIATEDPSLGSYLEATVHTGTACRFEPDPRHPVTWAVDAGESAA